MKEDLIKGEVERIKEKLKEINECLETIEMVI